MRITNEFGYIDFNRIGSNAHCINTIFVEPEHRRRGKGTKLIERLFKEIGFGEIYLIASGGYGIPVKELVAWYKRKGFKIEGRGTIFNNETEFEMMVNIHNGEVLRKPLDLM